MDDVLIRFVDASFNHQGPKKKHDLYSTYLTTNDVARICPKKHTQSPIENLGFVQTSRTVKKNSHVSSLRKGRALSQISMTHFFNDSLCAGNLILQEAGRDMLLFVDVSNEKLESSKAQVKWSLVKPLCKTFRYFYLSKLPCRT